MSFLLRERRFLMNRNESQLVIRDFPILLWIFGLVFAGVGALILYDSRQALVPAMIFLAVGLGILLFTNALTINVDRGTRTLKLEFRSVLRHTIKQVSFDEIADINVERSRSHGRGGSGYTYKVIVTRKDGQVIPFHSFSSSGWKKKERMAGRLRDFIGVVPQVQAIETRETDGVHWKIEPIGEGDTKRTRWYSPDIKTPGVFLFMAQKAEGQASGGLLASIGGLFLKQAIAAYGFQKDDVPGLDHATTLAPLDPALEPHFMAYSNNQASARHMLNPRVAMPLTAWVQRYPLKQFQMGSSIGQLVMLFGPNGVYLATMNRLQPDQANELAALGVEVIKSQSISPG
jgi:hypothetical protein